MSITPVNASPTFVAKPATPANANGKEPVRSHDTASKPLTGQAAIIAARAQYLKTGIDKDAAMGDPDHDAPKQAAKSLNITA